MSRVVIAAFRPKPGKAQVLRQVVQRHGTVLAEQGLVTDRPRIVDARAPEEDLQVVAEGVVSHGRAQARDGNADPIACLVRDGPRVLAGGTGRTEYWCLFVSYRSVAIVAGYVGPFNRHILLKLLNPPAIEPWT